jgi:hypothetical protein
MLVRESERQAVEKRRLAARRARQVVEQAARKRATVELWLAETSTRTELTGPAPPPGEPANAATAFVPEPLVSRGHWEWRPVPGHFPPKKKRCWVKDEGPLA